MKKNIYHLLHAISFMRMAIHLSSTALHFNSPPAPTKVSGPRCLNKIIGVQRAATHGLTKHKNNTVQQHGQQSRRASRRTE